jgi:hypothetical protein
MKRLLTSLAVACVVCGAIASTASATHSNGQGPDKDFTNGTAQLLIDTPFGTFPSQQHINAQSGPQGNTYTTGYFSTTIFAGPPVFPPGTVEFLEGDVLCLDANGSDEVDRGVITNSSGPVPVTGLGVVGFHEDNGEPGHGDGNPPDQAAGFLTPPPGPSPGCPPGSPFFGQPVEQGNFIVHDGI